MNHSPAPRAPIEIPTREGGGKALLRRTGELRDLGPQLCIPNLTTLESRL